ILLGNPIGSSDITIFNGHIFGGVTNLGSTYGGPGFAHGINSPSAQPLSIHVSGVTVSGCKSNGIELGVNGNATIIDSCTVQVCGGHGLSADVVSHSSAQQCGGVAIDAATALNCHGTATGGGWGVYAASTAENCSGFTVTGYDVYTS